MRRLLRVTTHAATLVTLVSVAACAAGPTRDASGSPVPSSPPDGTGYLVVADVRDAASAGHFADAPTAVQAQLVAWRNGCVTVLVDGVERVPVWPDGTVVAQDETDQDRYVVTLRDGRMLDAGRTEGDLFTADAVVDRSTAPYDDPTDPPGKVTTFLAYCDAGAAPVAFLDASTIRVLT